MRCIPRLIVGLVVLLVGSLAAFSATAQEDVIRRVIEGVKGAPKPATPTTEPKEDEGTVDVPRTPIVQLGPKFIRLHLQDGSVISGDLSISEVAIDTQFGKLVIPIDKILSFTPGLDANTRLDEQIQALIKDLGSDDYKTREQAHKDLAAMGRKVQKELEKFAADENAEVKRHVTEILKELEEAAEEGDDEGASVTAPLPRLDTVVTTDFTVLGRVTPAQFEIQSKYGPLTIQLADIARGEREIGERESFRKQLSITAANLAQRGFKNTGIKVQAGDRITIKAEGSLTMSPWGNNAQSGPDGAQNYGWYIPGQIPGGALCARISDKGAPFKVGTSSTFVAKQSGVLQLAIGIQGEYANEGYQFPGEYKVRLKVDPK
ncbi:MAG TPA: hypothetical protein VFB96_01270 [Pirellulaceae bacterium]|nr:hypothetical protein [Pirellulaceae bacterium]